MICTLPVKTSSLQSPGFQTAVDEERTASFLLIILSSAILGVWEYFEGKGNSKLPHYVVVCASTCLCVYKRSSVHGVDVITAAETTQKPH